jgi:hypothetical protein
MKKIRTNSKKHKAKVEIYLFLSFLSLNKVIQDYIKI